ncbi:N,N-dimethylaniline monooxygenase [Aureococcus anophagefferens]|nr:N,N-dimethylaniline monooxygenase [Aureococcus anophagefferens]
MPLRILTAIALLSAAHQGIQVAASSSNLGAPASDAEAAASLKGRFLRSSASAQDLLAAKEPAQLDDISHGQESLVALSGDSSSSDAEAAASLKDRFLRVSTSAQGLLAAKEPAQLDDISHGQESLVALSGDSSSSDVEAAASLKGRFLRSSASAQDLVKSKEPAQLDDISHGQESLVALSGDSSSSDAEAAASLKDRFLRVSTSAQDLLAAKEPAQLDDISHGQESLVALSGDSPSSDLDDISHGQESLVALSGDSPSSDVEAAASLKDRFLRSSASAQGLLAAKEPAQLDDISHGQESLVALSGDSPSSDVEAAASLKGRFLRSSASAQDLVKSKEPVQLDDISHGQESLVATSAIEFEDSMSEEQSARRLSDDYCEDTSGSALDSFGDSCDWYDGRTSCGNFDDSDFDANAMCCACGGGSDYSDGGSRYSHCETIKDILRSVEEHLRRGERRVPDDELLIEMREMNDEVRQGLAKILDSHRELQQGVATLLEEMQKLTKWDRARRLKQAHMEDNEIELDFVEVEPFAGGGQGSVHKAEYAGEIVCLKKFSLVGIGAQSARDKILSSFKEVGIMDKLRKHRAPSTLLAFAPRMRALSASPRSTCRAVAQASSRGDAITPKTQFIWAKDIAIGMAYLHEDADARPDFKDIETQLYIIEGKGL